MLLRTVLRVLNHLLAQEDWARERLKPFAGQSVCLRLGALALPLAVRPDGLFALADVAGDGDAVAATLTITLPPDAPLRALTDRQAVFTAAHIAGPAEFAETLGFVFRNLDWDAESDLARVVGDVAAHRLVGSGRNFARWHQRQANKLALNVAEYLTEENPTIERRADIADFCAQTTALAAEVAALEARIARLVR